MSKYRKTRQSFFTSSNSPAKYLPQSTLSDPSRVQERGEHIMRWVFLAMIALWMVTGLGGSIALFLLTRSNLAFVPLTAIVGFVSPFFGIIVRFFFWRSEDYKQEELKQILKVRKLELRCQVGKA